MTEKLVCRTCLNFGDCEIASDGKPKCSLCINKPVVIKPEPVVDQETCKHSINWGVVSGTCTKCKKYFEMDMEMQMVTGAIDADYRSW